MIDESLIELLNKLPHEAFCNTFDSKAYSGCCCAKRKLYGSLFLQQQAPSQEVVDFINSQTLCTDEWGTKLTSLVPIPDLCAKFTRAKAAIAAMPPPIDLTLKDAVDYIAMHIPVGPLIHNANCSCFDCKQIRSEC